MPVQITSSGATSKDVIHESNMAEILEKQERCYANRIGKQYGNFIVRSVWYDWENHKQMWKMECVKCGRVLVTASGREYAKGRAKGVCGCEARKERERKEQLRQEEADLLKCKTETEKSRWAGQTVDSWQVVCVSDSLKTWTVKCTRCGRIAKRSAIKMQDGTYKRCICEFNYGKYNDPEWAGKQYGFLKILRYENRNFVCECICGRETRIRPTFLLESKVKTCGNKECIAYGFTHGIEDGRGTERLGGVWHKMIQRCHNSQDTSYKTYGGRGIKVCPEWRYDYSAFREWAYANGYDENAPKGQCTIDRIDNDGDYCPENCHWITIQEQQLNKNPPYTFTPRPTEPRKYRPNIGKRAKWTINGETKSVIEWCEQYGVSVPSTMYRVKTKGMAPYEALTTPKMTNGRPKKG